MKIEYDTVQSQYEELQKQVSDTENELNTAQMEYNKKYNILKDKLVVLIIQTRNKFIFRHFAWLWEYC